MIGRRELITLLGGAAAPWPLAARAQQSDRVPRIGVLMVRAEDDREGQSYVAAFRRGLTALGWVPGENVEVEYRWQANNTTMAQAFAKELVEFRPDIIVVNATPSLAAMRQATRTIPIVFVGVADPVGQGFVPSLARPGGNITGFGLEEPSMGAKWVELLKEIAPRVARAAILFNPETAPFARMFLPSMEAAARSAALTLTVAPVSDGAEAEQAIMAAGREGGGLIALPDSFLFGRREMIVALTASQHTPAVYAYRAFVTDGGLIAYGIDRIELFRLATFYVDRILKGAKPADLPVQLPTKFELAINLKTAKSLGLDIPPSLLVRADEVIE
jgi:putative tryptophan/tyrosine transport system substrate-binding protein